jgi:hypothetical protein
MVVSVAVLRRRAGGIDDDDEDCVEAFADSSFLRRSRVSVCALARNSHFWVRSWICSWRTALMWCCWEADIVSCYYGCLIGLID